MTKHFDIIEVSANLDPKAVIDAFILFRGVTWDEVINSASRSEEVVWARHELTYCLRRLTNLSASDIGKAMGGRDTSTVINSLDRVIRRAAGEPDFADRLQNLRHVVQGFRPELGPIGMARGTIVHGGGQTELTKALAYALVTVSALLRCPDLTDTEARDAALSILGPAGGTSHG